MTEKDFIYIRPGSLEDVLKLREKYPEGVKFLAGGTFKPRLEEGTEIIVDLQDAGLDQLDVEESGISVGGLAVLQDLEYVLDSDGFTKALKTEFGLNVRNTLSLSNFLAQANGRSPILTCLLALEPTVYSLNQPQGVPLLQYLTMGAPADVVTSLWIPDFKKLCFDGVGRSPKDLPIVCVAAVKRADASIHVAAGGLVELLEGFDLTELDDDGKDYISWLFREAEDAWASAEYRQNLSQVLLARVLQKLERIV